MAINSGTGNLTDMLGKQFQLQTETYGNDLPNYTEAERALFIGEMVLALTDELHELLAEVGWKPWATSNHVNRDAAVGELVDAWHFFMNLMLVLGVDEEEFTAKYFAKHTKNQERQAAGYDGVSGKCPRCHRAYDDEFVNCTPPSVGDFSRGYCGYSDVFIDEEGAIG